MYVIKNGTRQLIDDATFPQWQADGWEPWEPGQTAAAADVTYDNATSELAATDTQAALDEIVARIVALETPPG